MLRHPSTGSLSRESSEKRLLRPSRRSQDDISKAMDAYVKSDEHAAGNINFAAAGMGGRQSPSGASATGEAYAALPDKDAPALQRCMVVDDSTPNAMALKYTLLDKNIEACIKSRVTI